MREQRDRTPVNALGALATRTSIPLAPIACEGTQLRFARIVPELEWGDTLRCAF
jgi:hypothetical protein